jgi:hypothetical protein
MVKDSGGKENEDELHEMRASLKPASDIKDI